MGKFKTKNFSASFHAFKFSSVLDIFLFCAILVLVTVYTVSILTAREEGRTSPPSKAMRFDMHCHTKEGSLDGKVTLEDEIARLKELGYDGMLVSDHNSFKAYRQYTRHTDRDEEDDFVLLRGVEYDTSDAGHILVIMPTDTVSPILEMRGLPVRLLIEIVHSSHGILGPAHPCGEKYLSLTNCKYYHKHPEVIDKFDFAEVFNSCVTAEANEKAAALAAEHHLPGTAGSDSHKIDCLGLAYTDFDQPIHNETELIDYIKGSPHITCGGSHYDGSTRDHLGVFYDFLLWLFYLYNRIGNERRRADRIAQLDTMLAENPTLFRRLRKLVVGGGWRDLVAYRRDRISFRSWLNRSVFSAIAEGEDPEDLSPQENDGTEEVPTQTEATSHKEASPREAETAKETPPQETAEA